MGSALAPKRTAQNLRTRWLLCRGRLAMYIVCIVQLSVVKMAVSAQGGISFECVSYMLV